MFLVGGVSNNKEDLKHLQAPLSSIIKYIKIKKKKKKGSVKHTGDHTNYNRNILRALSHLQFFPPQLPGCFCGFFANQSGHKLGND